MVYCEKVNCRYCNDPKDIRVIGRHEDTCQLNSKNIKYCPVCSGVIKSRYNTTTCSYACANSYFRSGPDNPNWKDASYVTTCFHYHEHKCVICDETNVVAVHHFDFNNKNNKPDNLIPMCPTHHQYMHSRFRKLIDKQVINYRKNFLARKV